MKLNNKNIILLLFALLIISAEVNYGQHIKAPIEVQMKIIPKILSLDKNFNYKKDDEYNIGIIYSSNQRNSVKIKKELEIAVKNKTIFIKKTKVKATFIDLSQITNLEKYIKEYDLNVIYITPLRGVDISSLSKICKQEKILTITGVLDFMQAGISVSFDIVNKKLKIVINNDSAKSEGVIFSSRLLRIAKLI